MNIWWFIIYYKLHKRFYYNIFYFKTKTNSVAADFTGSLFI